VPTAGKAIEQDADPSWASSSHAALLGLGFYYTVAVGASEHHRVAAGPARHGLVIPERLPHARPSP
jgi:hypothetical protein